MLGEDLILFRDGQGRPGWSTRCCHRGTTLYYGQVEERGIRCCYHGWLFDVEGRCLEQPCEPEGGLKRDRVRQPWYPVEERYGLIFAYMGPPEKKPVLPRYECLEELEPGEIRRGRRQLDRQRRRRDRALQLAAAFRERGRSLPRADPARHLQRRAVRRADGHHAEGEVGISPSGVKAISARGLDDGRMHYRVTEAACRPCAWCPIRGSAQYGVESLGWTLPIDDTHYRIYVAGRVNARRASSAPSARASTASSGPT